jgi:hypothetical protein
MSLCLQKYQAMKTYGGVEVWLHTSLTLTLYGSVWLASRPGRFTLEEGAPSTHWIGDRVGPRAGLDAVVKWKKLFSFPCLRSNPGRPSRSLVTVLAVVTPLPTTNCDTHTQFYPCSNR